MSDASASEASASTHTSCTTHALALAGTGQLSQQHKYRANCFGRHNPDSWRAVGRWAGALPAGARQGRALLQGAPIARPPRSGFSQMVAQPRTQLYRVHWSEQIYNRRLGYLGQKQEETPLPTQAVCSPLPASPWLSDYASRPSCPLAASCHLITVGLTPTRPPFSLFSHASMWCFLPSQMKMLEEESISFSITAFLKPSEHSPRSRNQQKYFLCLMKSWSCLISYPQAWPLLRASLGI